MNKPLKTGEKRLPEGLRRDYTWEVNVRNCRINEDLVLPIAGDPWLSEEWMPLIYYECGQKGLKYPVWCKCGRWRWIEFETEQDKFHFSMTTNYDELKKKIEESERNLADMKIWEYERVWNYL